MVNKTKAKEPSYSLDDIKQYFNDPDNLSITYRAKQDDLSLRFYEEDIVEVIQNLTSENFYKSMSPIKPGFTAWHDVYRARFNSINLYIKFQINNNKELIVSFKEDQNV